MRKLKPALTHAVLIVLTLVTLYPIAVVFGISLRPSGALYSTSLRLLPAHPTFEPEFEGLF